MPLIPRPVLMPLGQARDRAVNYTRGIRGPEYLVKDGEGRPWSVEADAVKELSSFDREGAFDEPLSGILMATRCRLTLTRSAPLIRLGKHWRCYALCAGAGKCAE